MANDTWCRASNLPAPVGDPEGAGTPLLRSDGKGSFRTQQTHGLTEAQVARSAAQTALT